MKKTSQVIKPYQFEEMLDAGVIKKFDESARVEYFISSFGNIYSRHKNSKKVIQMKLVPDGENYLRTVVNGKTVKAHILVAENFIRPRDRDKGEVINHLDLDRTNNNLSNLEITSQSLNAKHSWDAKRERRRLTPEKAEHIRMLHKIEGISLNALARTFNCTPTSIKQVVEGKTFTIKKTN